MKPLVSLLVALCVLASCASARDKALSATLVTVNAARDGFVAYDVSHQQSLLDSSADRATWDAKVATYRKKRELVVKAFEVTYRALAMAALEREPKTFALALEAAKQLAEIVNAFRGQP